MPQLLTFIPCEKIIIDENDRTISIIAILDTLTITIPPEATVPADAVTNAPWSVFTQWFSTPDELGTRYEQTLYLILPDGQRMEGGTTPFVMTEAKHRVVGQWSNFPVGQAGAYQLCVALRETGHTGWQEVARYPLVVVHARPAEITPTA